MIEIIEEIKNFLQGLGYQFYEWNEEIPNTGQNYFSIDVENYETDEQLTSMQEIGFYNLTIKLYHTNSSFNDYVNRLDEIADIVKNLKSIRGYAGYKGMSIARVSEDLNKSVAELRFNWRLEQ